MLTARAGAAAVVLVAAFLVLPACPGGRSAPVATAERVRPQARPPVARAASRRAVPRGPTKMMLARFRMLTLDVDSIDEPIDMAKALGRAGIHVPAACAGVAKVWTQRFRSAWALTPARLRPKSHPNAAVVLRTPAGSAARACPPRKLRSCAFVYRRGAAQVVALGFGIQGTEIETRWLRSDNGHYLLLVSYRDGPCVTDDPRNPKDIPGRWGLAVFGWPGGKGAGRLASLLEMDAPVPVEGKPGQAAEVMAYRIWRKTQDHHDAVKIRADWDFHALAVVRGQRVGDGDPATYRQTRVDVYGVSASGRLVRRPDLLRGTPLAALATAAGRAAFLKRQAR